MLLTMKYVLSLKHIKTYTGINFIHIEVAKVSALHETSKYT